MKKYILMAICFTALSVLAEDPALFYAVKPNTGVFPLPYELPDLGNRSGETFDWGAYLAKARSKADRAYRARVARRDYGQYMDEGGDSNSETRQRYALARKEFQAKCTDLIRRYRTKLKDEPKLLAQFDAYVDHHEKAIAWQTDFVGGSWAGGSGASTASADAKLQGYINYYRNLRTLGRSNHLQDLPK